MSKELNINSPAGTDNPSQGDDQIRALKQALVDNMSEDHYIDGTGGVYSGAENGRHAIIQLKEQSAGPAGESDYGYLYALEVDTATELLWKSEADTAVQLTRDGAIALENANLTNDTALHGLDTGGTERDLIKFSDEDDVEISSASYLTKILGKCETQDSLLATGGMAWEAGTYAADSIQAYGDEAWLNSSGSPTTDTPAVGSDWSKLVRSDDRDSSGLIYAAGGVTGAGAIATAGFGAWTVSRVDDGRYTLTINGGSGNYLVFISHAADSNNVGMNAIAITSGFFSNGSAENVKISGEAGSYGDRDWSFIAIKI